MPLRPWAMPLVFLLPIAVATAVAPVAAVAQPGASADPFLSVTTALPGCPVPKAPGMTPDQVRAEAHVRSQHGGSCFRVGRCRLPNSYLYDQEIIPRVQQYLRLDGRFDDTSVWVLGERRLVTLMGCVRSREQAQALENAVMLVDDVMGVIDQLVVLPP